MTLPTWVKFAKYTPLADENHLVLVQAYTLVEATKAEPVEVVKKQASPSVEASADKEISGANEIEKPL